MRGPFPICRRDAAQAHSGCAAAVEWRRVAKIFHFKREKTGICVFARGTITMLLIMKRMANEIARAHKHTHRLIKGTKNTPVPSNDRQRRCDECNVMSNRNGEAQDTRYPSESSGRPPCTLAQSTVPVLHLFPPIPFFFVLLLQEHGTGENVALAKQWQDAR